MAAIDEIEQDLLDNLDYEAVGSVAKAKAVVTAASKWLVLQPQEQNDQHNGLRFNNPQISALLARAQAYVAARDTSTSAARSRLFSMENYR